jgi:hypothetical protein
MINKLGDKEKKVQTHSIFVLVNFVKAKKERADVVVKECQIFLARNMDKTSHKLYTIAFLNRLASIVASKNLKVRLMLFKIFFSLFQKILGEEHKEEVDETAAPRNFKKYEKKPRHKNRGKPVKPTHKPGEI